MLQPQGTAQGGGGGGAVRWGGGGVALTVRCGGVGGCTDGAVWGGGGGVGWGVVPTVRGGGGVVPTVRGGGGGGGSGRSWEIVKGLDVRPGTVKKAEHWSPCTLNAQGQEGGEAPRRNSGLWHVCTGGNQHKSAERKWACQWPTRPWVPFCRRR